MANRTDFPDDDDGDVLFRLASKGIDLTQKRQIEFSCPVDSVAHGEEVANDLEGYGYSSSIFVDDGPEGTGNVSIYASLLMKPDYELLILEQRRISLILKTHGTYCDGWMTES